MTFPIVTIALDALNRTATTAIETGQLNNATPCSEWTVAQVIFHAAGDQHAWASQAGSGSLPSYDPFNPPHQLAEGIETTLANAIQAATAAWAGVDPAASSLNTPLPPVPVMAPELAAAACALDAAVHAWDIAVATRQPTPLTATLAQQLMPAARATAEPLRGFAYAAALPEISDDHPADALLRYLGRDPRWKP